MKGRYYDQIRAFENATAEYEKVITLNPNNVNALHALSKIYLKKGDFLTSYKLLKKTEKIDKSKIGSAQTFKELSAFYGSIMDLEKAELYASKSRELDSTNNDYFWQAWILLSQKKYGEARNVVVSQFDTTDGSYYHWNGMYNLFTNNIDSAVVYFKSYVDFFGENLNMPAWVLYGTALMENGEVDKGRQILEKQLDKYEDLVLSNKYEEWDIVSYAGITSYLGNNEKGLEYIKKASLISVIPPIPYMEIDPLYNNLRKHPEFVKLITQKKEEFKSIREEIFRLEALGDL